ncbi:MAG: VWA domain-containing protein [Planctomycetes bacterium]|nr:VWA domain-containing protein [Planctomycetota bacterium]
MNDSASSPTDRYQGFDLNNVCWGYRDIFRKSIDGFFDEGLLGENREEVTNAFFGMLRNADKHFYDHILNEFLSALTQQTKWIFEIPSIFEDVVEVGQLLSASKLYFGIGFFKLLGDGALGDTPARVRHGLTLCRRLYHIDGELAFSLLRGYSKLYSRLTPEEIELYVNDGLRIHAANGHAGNRFMAAESKASESIILKLTRECRLESIKGSLKSLLRALTGFDVEVDDFRQLDSDDLIESGSRMVAMYRWLYLPAVIRHFPATERNRDWYRLCTIITASMLLEQTFSVLHGHPEFEKASDLVGEDTAKINVFTILEYLRGIIAARSRWPGCRRLIDFGLATEFSENPPLNEAERVFCDAASVSPCSDLGMRLVKIANGLENVFSSASILDSPEVKHLIQSNRGLGESLMRPYAFLPDFRFHGKVGTPPSDAMISDLKDRSKKSVSKPENKEDQSLATSHGSDDNGNNTEQRDGKSKARFWYPEWNQAEGDYYENWCGIISMESDKRGHAELPESLMRTAKKVQRIFERLKPDIVRVERRLESGDSIDVERLIKYRVDSRVDVDPRIDFYEKPKIMRRDLAVLILLDISGSTAQSAGQAKFLEIEKYAALILGQGLNSLDDRFAVAGFCSSGREQCEYHLFKNFDAAWDDDARSRIMSAYPHNSTRIGAALRHSGYLLSRIEAKQRLILLITDGKPLDSGYDPNTRYAQHDVRMACEENERQSISTFAISTEENSLADMEIMFPHRRYTVIPDIGSLPDILPRMYLKISV